MKRPILLSALGLLVAGAGATYWYGTAPKVVKLPGPTLAGTTLPNGWRITPAGEAVSLAGDMPLKSVLSPDGKYMLILTAGYHDHSLSVVDVATKTVVQSVGMRTAWAGLAFDPTGKKVYVSGGKLAVQIYDFDGGKLTFNGTLDCDWIPAKERHIADLAFDKTGALWLVNIATDTVYRYTNGEAKGVKVGYRPYAVAFDPAESSLMVSNWGDGSVSVLDPQAVTEKARIKVGSHPNEVICGADGRFFVANAGSNSVSVIKEGKVVETISTSLDPKALVGTTPDSLALSPKGQFLYVANADNNDLAVVDISNAKESHVAGFIPTGWYPSLVTVDPSGRIYVGTAKGLRFSANPAGPKTKSIATAHNGKFKFDYIAGLLSGNVNVIEPPKMDDLIAYTDLVRQNVASLKDQALTKGEADDLTKNALRKIKHVVYIIRENRTYDQVLGDLARGNGDPSLVIFGQETTPNAHKIVNDYVLLDNIYCNGEVSEDGHQWCNAAYATDFTEKAWVTSYSGRGEVDADERLTASPAGYLWDACRKKGLDFYSYGEFASFKSDPDSAPKFTGTKGLDGHASAEWAAAGSRAKDSGRDYKKCDVFIDDLKKAETTGKWPNFMVMSLGEDHTSGLRAGSHTPWASVASNDLAVGKMVDAISHSKFWKETAIFIIEDDAQNGADHVDAHRTVAMVISPYVKRTSIDSTLYTTASMVRTMEIILGLAPMTQFDEKATPMYRCFTTKPDFTPYTSLEATTDINAMNPTSGELVKMSNALDWSGYDRADPDKLNYILWHAAKPGVPMPAPIRSAISRD